MSESTTRPVPENFHDAHINADSYQVMYQRSLAKERWYIT